MYGDEILALFKTHGKSLGISQKAYDLVYEGFWDLYCKKPVSPADIPIKKLEGFIQRVKLITPPPADVIEDDGTVTKSISSLPLKALVRVRIPLIRPSPSQLLNNRNPNDSKLETLSNNNNNNDD